MLCGLFASPPALAHERIGSVSNAIVTVRGHEVDYYLNLPPLVYRILRQEVQPDATGLKEYFTLGLRVTTWDAACGLSRATLAPLATGNTIVHLVYDCPREVQDLTVASDLFYDFDETHIQFVRLAARDDPARFLAEAVLTARESVFHVSDVETGATRAAARAYSFFRLGVEHLFTGLDHILFLLSVIVAVSVRQTVLAVTSFTVAHSLTMALAFLGLVSLPAAVVEPLIALTIVYVAVENLLARGFRRRWVLTFVFGLVHGLGFVGALKEITVSRNELVVSLVSFNLGIETAQLVIVLGAVLALRLLRSHPWLPLSTRAFSAGVGVVGTVWFVARVVDFGGDWGRLLP